MKPAAVDGLLGIGEVLDQLRHEFPDVSVSKIRFLETEELVMPLRTASGYRKFSHADVKRLRYVLNAQRERYLPLKVIREELDAMDRGLEPMNKESHGVRVPRALVTANPLGDFENTSTNQQQLRLTRDELCRESGINEELLKKLEQYDLVSSDDEGFFDIFALRICSCAFELTGFGIEPRHLRSFKVAADREIGLVEAVITPYLHRTAPGSHSRAQDLSREVASLALKLHASLIQTGLKSHLDV